jgi:hypothetical protein
VLKVSAWLDGGGNGATVDVVELLVEPATKGLAEIVQTGALLSLGTTSDGGALGITVTVDGKWRREYVRNADELAAWLAEAVPGVVEAAGGSRPSAAPRNGQRRPRTR